MYWKGCCFVLMVMTVCFLLPGCRKYSLEKGLGLLQQKKVVAVEVKDVETGSGWVVRIEDEKIINKLLEVAAKVKDKVMQMSCWSEITFYFGDGDKAVGTFAYDPNTKEFYIADWVLKDPELWELLKEPLGLPDEIRGVPTGGKGPIPSPRGK